MSQPVFNVVAKKSTKTAYSRYVQKTVQKWDVISVVHSGTGWFTGMPAKLG